jgi:Mg2+-importing ATPase
MLKREEISYYSNKPVDKIFAELDTSLRGLSHYESEKRLKEFGKNTLVKKKELHPVFEFLSHFKNPLILILISASLILFFFKENLNAFIILAIVFIGVVLEFFQEFNAGKAAEKLKESVKTTTIVIRDGRRIDVKTENICVGDIIELTPGALVPADARIISSKELFVNQSALTGESLPSEKSEKTAKRLAMLPEMNNLIFLGTSVVSGSGTAVVIKTGIDTEFGKISKELVQAPPQTEFEKGLASFGYLIMRYTLLLVLFIFLFNSIMKHNILQSFMFSVAVAVGLTPELLPMIMSVNMAKGSLNMAKKGAIVKTLSSIPNFGSMDILCTDKTGTLTEDKIKLIKYTDVFGNSSKKVLKFAYVNSSFHTGITNPLDSAILNFKKIQTAGYEKIDEIPFDFVRRKMSIVVKNLNKLHIITKGSPEEVFKSSTVYEINGRQLKLDQKVKDKITHQYHNLSSQGYRVLAIAYKDVKRKKEYTKNDESNLILLGFIAFFDPPKKGVGSILKEIHKTGIEVKIITGDNELVTKKICEDIGLEIKGVLLGPEIKKLTDDALKVRVENTTIFARFTPDQKNRIIYALKSNGHVVGYLGDGINDAPSLQTADIGLSVNSAVDVAKESADIILTHKSLEVLKEGVLEGRKTFGNTLKYILMGLSSNFGNMFSVLGAVLFLPFLPMLPVQILLNNLIYDFSQITIPSDNVDKEYTQKPKRWNMKFIKRFMLTFGPVSSVFDFITFFVLFGVFHASAAVFQTGWFMESLATQTLVIHIIRTQQTPFLKSTASKYLIISTLLCVTIGWLIPYTPIGPFLGFKPLPLSLVIILASLVIIYLIIVEIVKRIFYKKYSL